MNANRTTMELDDDRGIIITRTFRTSADILFDAWTKPEYVTRWWAPKSRGVTVAQCDVDLRPGGSYRYVLAHEGGEPFAFLGKYVEVVRPTKLVYTQSFEPALGTVLPGEAVITATFEERNGATTLVSRELYPSKEVRAQVLESGMEDGMRETYEQLDELVTSLRR